uniref:Palmitoyltransferase n=1 Tax=Globodera rostochiensis TaxID=31243 RepID=A0A914HZN4_GLORO
MCVHPSLRWAPVLLVWAFILWIYCTYAIIFCLLIVESISVKLIFLIVFHILFFLMLWSNVQTVCTPIRRPPEHFILPLQIRAELCAATNRLQMNAILERFVSDQKIVNVSRFNNGDVRYCTHCFCIKPYRCHHSSTLGHCVLKFDHHCPWVNSCINFNNYKFFVLFICYVFALCLFGFFTILPYFIAIWRTDEGSKPHIVWRLLVSLLFLVTGPLGFSTGGLFIYHLFLISNNLTTLESIGLPDSKGFDLGIRRNFGEVFGTDKLKWLLPVFSSPGDGINYPQKPNQTAEGGASDMNFLSISI